ncbi:helix-turn-helix domain-containing protein [Candidatus Phytoplasma pruni]|uniref:Helix-turn-helix domain-containing protein n=2 Tax=Candidatus Phytoplasma pruni TaxID=479893 RepID=A0A851HJS6_9MOLU|nr:helix-turn-helix transcriptional regulator [Candidatus Phytoplasma pruni]NWN45689.1 helix-turn-helix domain-containing protein [Candidatus Phytoplasma pruni]
MDIGFQIRTLRLKNKLTQKELSEKINVTSGYISQIENNLISPSLKTLFPLLEIFNVSVSDFFKQEKNLSLINTKEDFISAPNHNLKHTIYNIFPKLEKNKIKPIIIEIEPQGQTIIQTRTINDEFCYVLEGEVVLVLNKKHYLLKKDDTFYLSINEEYHLLNNSSEKTKILKVTAF